MGLNLAKLSAQGRAYSAVRPWKAEELEALLMLENERNLSRLKAADYVRNGIMTLEAFDKATEDEFVPKSLDEVHEEAEAKMRENGQEFSESSENEDDGFDDLKVSELKELLEKKDLSTDGKKADLIARLRGQE